MKVIFILQHNSYWQIWAMLICAIPDKEMKNKKTCNMYLSMWHHRQLGRSGQRDPGVLLDFHPSSAHLHLQTLTMGFSPPSLLATPHVHAQTHLTQLPERPCGMQTQPLFLRKTCISVGQNLRSSVWLLGILTPAYLFIHLYFTPTLYQNFQSCPDPTQLSP